MLPSLITIPTSITLMRIVLVPFIVHCMISGAWISASVLFVLAALTDLVDGALARFLNQVTVFGGFLDPLADKLLLLSCFTTLAFIQFPALKIPLWFVLAVTINELILVVCAVYWGILKKTLNIKPTRLGRLTALGQILVIGWLLLCGFSQAAPQGLFSLLVLLMILTRACTLFQYSVIVYKGEEW